MTLSFWKVYETNQTLEMFDTVTVSALDTEPSHAITGVDKTIELWRRLLRPWEIRRADEASNGI